MSIFETICELALLVLALLHNFKETAITTINGHEILKQIPNATLSYVGWLLTWFSLLHIYPPRQLTDKFKSLFQKTVKSYLVILVSLVLTNCKNSIKRIKKMALVKADRKARVYLPIYQDSTFELTLTGIRAHKGIFKGEVKIPNNNLFFAYSDSIPKAGKTAVFNDKVVAYIDGEYPERVNISFTNLTK